MNHRHEVEAFGNGIGMPDLLVASVPLVVLVAKHRDPLVGMVGLERTPDLEGPVLGGIVDHEEFAIERPPEFPRDPFEDLLEGRLGVVGDHEDEQSPALVPRAAPGIGGC